MHSLTCLLGYQFLNQRLDPDTSHLVLACFWLVAVVAAGALYVCTEDSFPIKRLQQLIGEQLVLRPDVPVDLVERLRFGDHVYIEHTADLVSLTA